MEPHALAADRTAEVEEVRAHHSPEVFERAYNAWAALGYANDFRHVAAYYQRLHDLEETFTPEGRAASRAADEQLRNTPPPASACLRRLYPHLYPQQDHAQAVPFISESDAAAHPDVRRFVLDHGLTVKALLAEFRAYAARENQIATYYHLLCYVNRPRPEPIKIPAAPFSGYSTTSESSTSTVSCHGTVSVAVTFVTSQTVPSTSQTSQSTFVTFQNTSTLSSIQEISESEPCTSSQAIEAVPMVSNDAARTTPYTPGARSHSNFTPPSFQEPVASTSTNSNVISDSTSNSKTVFHGNIVSGNASSTSFSTPPMVSDTIFLKSTPSTSESGINIKPDWYKESKTSKSKQTKNTPTKSRLVTSTPTNPRGMRDMATFASSYEDAAPIDPRFMNAIPLNLTRLSDTHLNPFAFSTPMSHGSFDFMDYRNTEISSLQSLYRTAMLGGLPYDMSNIMTQQHNFNMPISPRSSFDMSGNSYSSLDVTKSSKSSSSSRSKYNRSFSPGRAGTSTRRSIEPSLNRADYQDARGTEPEAGPSWRPDSLEPPDQYQSTNRKSPSKLYVKGANRGKKKPYTKQWREECTRGKSKEAKSAVRGKSRARGKSRQDTQNVSSDTSAGASGSTTSAGRAASGGGAGRTRGAELQSSAVSTTTLSDVLDKLSLDKDSTAPP